MMYLNPRWLGEIDAISVHSYRLRCVRRVTEFQVLACLCVTQVTAPSQIVSFAVECGLYIHTYTYIYIQGGPAKVKPTYFTHQNAQMRYYSAVLFYNKKYFRL